MVSTIETTREDVAAGFVAQAQALLPRIAELAGPAEEARRIPQETIDAFADMGFFRVMVPKRYGGYELDISAVTNIGRLVGRHCASSGWVLTWLGWHSRGLSMYPPTVQDYVFREGWGLTAGSPAPMGIARRVPGGYRVTGRWSWATAVHHSDWVILGGMIPEEKRHLGLLIPDPELVVHDNWHTEGMRATGSDDVEARDVFVPEDYALDRALIGRGTAPGQLWNTGPLYRVPYGSLACLVAGATGIGVGEWAVDDFRARLGSRSLTGSTAKQGEAQVEQVRLANLTAEMRAGALLFDEAVELVASACRGEREMTVEERATVRMWVAHALAVARHTVVRVAEASGSKAHFLHDPLQRAVRDIGTLSSHHVFSGDRNGETYGRVMLGLEYDASAI